MTFKKGPSHLKNGPINCQESDGTYVDVVDPAMALDEQNRFENCTNDDRQK